MSYKLEIKAKHFIDSDIISNHDIYRPITKAYNELTGNECCEVESHLCDKTTGIIYSHRKYQMFKFQEDFLKAYEEKFNETTIRTITLINQQES